MSYILEALKKSQAERQLGNAPTIHAIPLEVTADATAGGRRERMWMALAAGALVLAAAALWTWRQQSQPGAPAAPAVVAAAPSSVQGQVVAAPLPQPTAVARQAFAPAAGGLQAAVPHAPPAPVPGASPVVARAAPPAAVTRDAAQKGAAPAARSAPAVAAVAATGRSEAGGADEQVRSLRELPEAIQREVPQVAIGGYIYSKNPADRLLLVDKVLRREGDLVGPGLTLEKLLPKAAVMNYRGYRYRVPY